MCCPAFWQEYPPIPGQTRRAGRPPNENKRNRSRQSPLWIQTDLYSFAQGWLADQSQAGLPDLLRGRAESAGKKEAKASGHRTPDVTATGLLPERYVEYGFRCRFAVQWEKVQDLNCSR